VRAEWIDCPAGADEPARAVAKVRAMVAPRAPVAEAAAEIVAAVRARGDAAVQEYEGRFGDGGEAPYRVPAAELAAALETLDPPVRAGLEVARENVRAVAEAGRGADAEVTLAQGHRVRLREIPVRRAAVYAPGGRAPYPSSVLMGAVTAQAAGVEQVVLCAVRHPVVLAAACACAQIDEVHAMGGAQGDRRAGLRDGLGRCRPTSSSGRAIAYVQGPSGRLGRGGGIDGFAGAQRSRRAAGTDATRDFVALDLLAHGRARAEDSPVVAAARTSGGSRPRGRARRAAARSPTSPRHPARSCTSPRETGSPSRGLAPGAPRARRRRR
jgi:histidinol dehydrogenase